MKEYFESYTNLVNRLDDFFEKTRRRYPHAVACKEGCSDCCQRDISLWPFEADILVKAVLSLGESARMRILQRAKRAEADPEFPCPLLYQGKCEVYENRSVICRTHGLACLVSTTNGKKELSFCPYNFQGLMKIDGDCVLDLDPVNQALATINHLACSDSGTSPHRVKISRAMVRGLTRSETGLGS